MTEMTDPEHRAQRVQAKRYRAAIRRQGTCMACIHRNREETFWGRSVCSVSEARQHPICERDGKLPRFVFDPDCLKDLAHAA